MNFQQKSMIVTMQILYDLFSTSSPSRFRANKLKIGDLICYRPLKKTSLVLDVLTHVKIC